MLIDYNLQMSDAQSVTADAPSTNVIDLGSDRDIGPGEDMKIVVTFDVAMGGSNPTLAVQVQTDDNSSFSSASTILTSRSIAAAAVGHTLVLGLPDTNERYMRLNYDVGGTSPTMTVSAAIVKDAQQYYAYPDSANVA
tara:strand:- start:151 stop:564 length:414 start_codon:yes stop_codon:yes gene_type:complete